MTWQPSLSILVPSINSAVSPLTPSAETTTAIFKLVAALTSAVVFASRSFFIDGLMPEAIDFRGSTTITTEFRGDKSMLLEEHADFLTLRTQRPDFFVSFLFIGHEFALPVPISATNDLINSLISPPHSKRDASDAVTSMTGAAAGFPPSVRALVDGIPSIENDSHLS